jgi:hypothetical protein
MTEEANKVSQVPFTRIPILLMKALLLQGPSPKDCTLGIRL